MSILNIKRIGYAEGTSAAGLVFKSEPYEGPYEGPLFLGGPQRGQYYNQPEVISNGLLQQAIVNTKPKFTPQSRPSLVEDFYKSSFYDPKAMGTAALVPVTLPTGEEFTFSGGAPASQFQEYLKSLGYSTNRGDGSGYNVIAPTPVPSPTMPTPTMPTPVPSPTMPTPTMPEPNIPGFQSFSGSGREGIMNLLSSRFRDLNLGMMNRLRNDPGSFYSRNLSDQTSSMPSGLQSLFFRSGNNLNEIPNSMNIMRRAFQSPSYTNTGIATSFTPNFVSLERRKRRR